MAKIEGISKLSYSQKKIDSVHGYSKNDFNEKFKEVQKNLAEMQEVHAYLSKYSNPDKLSFDELLQQAIKENNSSDDDEGFILDIGINS